MASSSRRSGIRIALTLVLVAQATLTGLFLYDLLSARIGLRTQPLTWEMRELLEMAGAVGLLLGMGLGGLALWRTRNDLDRMRSRIRVASAEFYTLVREEFSVWGLTKTEAEVGMFILKGLTNAEISDVTGKKEGTVKSQTNALFKKADVANRSQFLGHFVEILMAEPLVTVSEN